MPDDRQAMAGDDKMLLVRSLTQPKINSLQYNSLVVLPTLLIVVNIVTPDRRLTQVQQYCSISLTYLTTMNNVGSTTLFETVLVILQQRMD